MSKAISQENELNSVWAITGKVRFRAQNYLIQYFHWNLRGREFWLCRLVLERPVCHTAHKEGGRKTKLRPSKKKLQSWRWSHPLIDTSGDSKRLRVCTGLGSWGNVREEREWKRRLARDPERQNWLNGGPAQLWVDLPHSDRAESFIRPLSRGYLPRQLQICATKVSWAIIEFTERELRIRPGRHHGRALR